MVDARTFQALSDPTRLKILSLLGDGSMNVTAMVEKLDVTQPAVSRHLKVLREAGLIVDARNGKWVEYSSNPPAVREAAEYLKGLYRAGGGGLRDAAGAAAPVADDTAARVRMPRVRKRRSSPLRPRAEAGPGSARNKGRGPGIVGRRSARPANPAGSAESANPARPVKAAERAKAAEPVEPGASRYVVERDEDFIDDLML